MIKEHTLKYHFIKKNKLAQIRSTLLIICALLFFSACNKSGETGTPIDENTLNVEDIQKLADPTL